MEHGAVDLDEGAVGPVAHLVDGLGDGALAHAGLAGDEDVGLGVGGILHQRPQPLHGIALKDQRGGGGPGAQLRDLLRVLLQGVLEMLVVALDGVDLLQGDGVEAHHIFQLPAAVAEGDAYGHDIFMGVVDGLGGNDLLPLADDIRRDAGLEGAVCLQIKGGFAYDGAVGKSEVVLIGLTDPQNGALGVGEHHVICQDQVIFGAEDLEKPLQIDVLVQEVAQMGFL